MSLALGHGITQGAMSALRGQKFKTGFISGIAGKVTGAVINNMDLALEDSFTKATIAALIGGIAAQASGGDFVEGAMTAMVVYLWNDGIIEKTQKFTRETGLYKFGDYLGRAFGLRDAQYPSAITTLPEYKDYKPYKEEAIREAKIALQITKTIIKHPEITKEVYKIYNQVSEEEIKKNLLIKGYLMGFATAAPVTISEIGNFINKVDRIEDFLYENNLIDGGSGSW